MLIMSKRVVNDYEDSEEDNTSDEDDGNFKRRKRHSSGSDDQFMQKTLVSIGASTQTKDIPSLALTKPLKVYDSRRTQPEPQFVAKQRELNERLSKLPKYDDLFDTNSTDSTPKALTNGCVKSSADIEDITDTGSGDHMLKTTTNTAVEVTTDKDGSNGNQSDATNGDATAEVVDTKPADPRMRRLEKFSSEPKTGISTTIPPIRSNPIPLKDRINYLLNKRKPMEAYTELKLEAQVNELHKYKDQLLVMAKDWFPSLVDSAYDPRAVFIETQTINTFQNLIKDVFSLKTKLREFWESIIIVVNKFIDESKIKEVPQLLAKLRWILIRDVREYLIAEDVKIGLKASNILIDHRIKLDSRREQHRRNFEAMSQHLERSINSSIVNSIPVPVLVPTPQPKNMFSDMISLSTPMQSISNRMSAPAVPQMPSKVNKQFVGSSDQYQSSSSMHSYQPYANQCSDPRMVEKIVEFLRADQFLRLTQMLNRHISANTYTFVEDVGRALRLFAQTYQNCSIFMIYQKFHDTIKLNSRDFPGDRLRDVFERLLKEFAVTVQYNPKEWLQIREHSRENLAHIELNAFYPKLVLIEHNVILNLDYFNASNQLVIQYEAFEQQIPLISTNALLKDPRIEFQSDERVISSELIDLDGVEPIGNFSPFHSEGSSPNSPSPPYPLENLLQASPTPSQSSPPQPSPPQPLVSLSQPSTVAPSPSPASPVASPSKPIETNNKINKNIIQLSKPKPKFDESELKSIVRRVVVSDSSDSE